MCARACTCSLCVLLFLTALILELRRARFACRLLSHLWASRRLRWQEVVGVAGIGRRGPVGRGWRVMVAVERPLHRLFFFFSLSADAGCSLPPLSHVLSGEIRLMCQGAKVNLFCTLTLPRFKEFSFFPFFSFFFVAGKMRNAKSRVIIVKMISIFSRRRSGTLLIPQWGNSPFY